MISLKQFTIAWLIVMLSLSPFYLSDRENIVVMPVMIEALVALCDDKDKKKKRCR
jgi:hypothetical protein